MPSTLLVHTVSDTVSSGSAGWMYASISDPYVEKQRMSHRGHVSQGAMNIHWLQRHNPLVRVAWLVDKAGGMAGGLTQSTWRPQKNDD